MMTTALILTTTEDIRNKHDNPAMVEALHRFTRLRSLDISGGMSLQRKSPLMEGLSGLTSLTRLSVSSVILPGLEQLCHLPAQLKELELEVPSFKCVQEWVCCCDCRRCNIVRRLCSAISQHAAQSSAPACPAACDAGALRTWRLETSAT
jgi:hypothetical protein